MTDSVDVPGQPPRKILIAIRKIFKPLVRMSISFGIPISALIELLKEVFVEVAESEYKIDEKRPTDSRVTLLTGVHRKDVRRLRNQQLPEDSVPDVISLGALVVAKWVSDPDYIDSNGQPLALMRNVSSGSDGTSGAPSFESLIESVSRKDIRSRVVLDEWLRLGVVEINTSNQVNLCSDAFVPQSGLDEKAYFLGKNIHDHLAVIVHNLAEENAMLERCVYYDGLSTQAVDELHIQATTETMKALKNINQLALRLQSENQSSINKSYRFNFGAYFYGAKVDEIPASNENS